MVRGNAEDYNIQHIRVYIYANGNRGHNIYTPQIEDNTQCVLYSSQQKKKTKSEC